MNLPLLMNGAEDAEVRSGTSSTIRLAKNLSMSGIWLRMLKLVVIVMTVMMKRSKDHFFSRNQTYLQSILPPYALEKR